MKNIESVSGDVLSFRSYGVMVWEMLTCAVPYQNSEATAVMWGAFILLHILSSSISRSVSLLTTHLLQELLRVLGHSLFLHQHPKF